MSEWEEEEKGDRGHDGASGSWATADSIQEMNFRALQAIIEPFLVREASSVLLERGRGVSCGFVSGLMNAVEISPMYLPICRTVVAE